MQDHIRRCLRWLGMISALAVLITIALLGLARSLATLNLALLEHVSPRNISFVEPNAAHPESPQIRATTEPPGWAAAVNVGDWLLCMMNAPFGTTTQSTWTNFASLVAWGWSYGELSEQGYMTSKYQGLFDEYGISSGDGDWLQASVTHEKVTNYEPPDAMAPVVYPLTEALYSNYFNLKDGVIIADSNFSPDFRNQRRLLNIPANRIVLLKQWSDIMWLVWEHLHVEYGGANTNLNHIIRSNIINKQTQKRMQEVMGVTGAPPPWPGVKYSVVDDRAKALLNTSNSVRVAFLLGQHKDPGQFGVRIIDQVTLFSTQSSVRRKGPVWNMHFRIVPGPLAPGQL